MGAGYSHAKELTFNAGAAAETWPNVTVTLCDDMGYSDIAGYEGGMATPLVCHRPAGLKQPGGIRHSLVRIVAFMATILDLPGAGYPENRDGVPLAPTEDLAVSRR
ncbi:MAG: hypothetical protein GVY16_00895 [Planctomycetes bacterium]|jgi:arylsulfatase A-like enzyme|nr:hypothetical protein [Planctomycetota bacterium]